MEFSVVAEYTTMSRKQALQELRGDSKTFASESMAFTLDAKGDGPVATAARTGKEQVVSDVSSMKRSKLAKEFDIAKVHVVPVAGGVLEYGTPASDYLSGDLMKASLKMRCDTSGGGYALYWKETKSFAEASYGRGGSSTCGKGRVSLRVRRKAP